MRKIVDHEKTLSVHMYREIENSSASLPEPHNFAHPRNVVGFVNPRDAGT